MFFSAFRTRRPPRRQLPHLPGSATTSACERALLATLHQNRPRLLERLLVQIGPHAFAQILTQLPVSHRMHALHLLPDEARATLCAHLPTALGTDTQRWPQWHLFLLRRVWGSLLPLPSTPK